MEQFMSNLGGLVVKLFGANVAAINWLVRLAFILERCHVCFWNWIGWSHNSDRDSHSLASIWAELLGLLSCSSPHGLSDCSRNWFSFSSWAVDVSQWLCGGLWTLELFRHIRRKDSAARSLWGWWHEARESISAGTVGERVGVFGRGVHLFVFFKFGDLIYYWKSMFVWVDLIWVSIYTDGALRR